MYKLTNRAVIIRVLDNASIPMDGNNADYAEFLRWLSSGNAPQAAEPPEATVDFSDIDSVGKPLKAAVLAAAMLSGKTLSQARAAFKQAWEILQ